MRKELPRCARQGAADWPTRQPAHPRRRPCLMSLVARSTRGRLPRGPTAGGRTSLPGCNSPTSWPITDVNCRLRDRSGFGADSRAGRLAHLRGCLAAAITAAEEQTGQVQPDVATDGGGTKILPVVKPRVLWSSSSRGPVGLFGLAGTARRQRSARSRSTRPRRLHRGRRLVQLASAHRWPGFLPRCRYR